MPELPEVEAVAGALTRVLAGARFECCEFMQALPRNVVSTRALSHIFHPFKELPLPFPELNLRRASYVRHYQLALRQFFLQLSGSVLAGVVRRGKYLLFVFAPLSGSGCGYILAHLRMAGKFLVSSETLLVQKPENHLHLALRFKPRRGGSKILYYSDPRFGELLPLISGTALPLSWTTAAAAPLPAVLQRVWQTPHTAFGKHEYAILSCLTQAAVRRLARVGLEPLAPRTLLPLIRIMQKLQQKCPHRTLYAFLLDGRHIAGIGNIYANELCHRAELYPLKQLQSLKYSQLQNIARALRHVLRGAVRRQGSSLDKHLLKTKPAAAPKNSNSSTTHFRLPDGSPGTFARVLHVYGRNGLPCLRRACTGTIVRAVSNGRSLYICPQCQH